MTKFLGNLIVLYLVIGVAIVAVQRFSATPCGNVMGGERHKLFVETGHWLLAALTWPQHFYKNVWAEDMPLSEYFAPSVCAPAPAASV